MALRMRKLFATFEKRAPGHKKISEVSSAAEISPERSLKQKPLTRPLLVYSTADGNAGTCLQKDSYRVNERLTNKD